MDKVIFIILTLTIGSAVLLSGLSPIAQKSKDTVVSDDFRCLDFDPPNTSRQVTFKGAKYNLIKMGARVPGPNPKSGEEDKYGLAMEKIGELDDGTPVRNLNKPNIFGQSLDNFKNIIYVQREQKDGATFFDIYIKDGAEIPDIARNCKTMGGNVAVNLGAMAPGTFPPGGFNRNEILNLNPNFVTGSLAPAYVLAPAPNSKVSTSSIEPQLTPDDKNFGALKIGPAVYNLYHHLGLLYLIKNDDAYVYMNSPVPIDTSAQIANKSLQLNKIQIVSSPLYTWHTPECKPAIYLYPREKTEINVRVLPKGHFTYTDPPYRKDGWQIVAYPDGKIESSGKTYPYLYYESKILDSYLNVPKQGFSVNYSELATLFDRLLPSLGLSDKETADFKNYWLRALPYANYYFVGVMGLGAIDDIEPIIITPKPESIIRVRLYFEALEQPKTVAAPEISAPQRIGYLAVEWGGMVKSNRDGGFTCSQ